MFLNINFLIRLWRIITNRKTSFHSFYKIFSGIAIFLSCLGLYGLVAFMAVQRKKEIGIRKVLGAPVRDIVVLLSKKSSLF